MNKPLRSAASVRGVLGESATPEQNQHKKQIASRPKELEKAMMRCAAVTVCNGADSAVFDSAHPLLPIGTTTFMVVRRFWSEQGHYPTILLAGYRAHLEEGKIVLGGEKGCVLAYDLKYIPRKDTHNRGKICPPWKRTTLQVGLRLDAEIEKSVKTSAQIQQNIVLPLFWAAFHPSEMQEVEDCPAARRLCLDSLRAGVELDCMKARGGRITSISSDVDLEGALTLRPGSKHRGVAIGWDGTEFEPAYVQFAPSSAVLRPYVKVEATLEKDAPLGDFAPRRAYPSWAGLVSSITQDTADWLLAEVVTGQDIQHDGMALRRVELCPGSLTDSAKIYEDLSWMLDENTREGNVQMLNGRTLDSLRSSAFGGLISADLVDIRPEWHLKFS